MPLNNESDTNKRRRAELSEFERGVIIGLYMAQKKQVEIASMRGIARSTISDTIARWKRTGSTKSSSRCGAPKKLSKTDRNALRLSVKRNPAATYADLQASLAAAGVHVHENTIRKYLQEEGFRPRKPELNSTPNA